MARKDKTTFIEMKVISPFYIIYFMYILYYSIAYLQ